MPDPRELVVEMYLAFASELAEAARGVILPYFRNAGLVEAKGDGSPVTAADRGAEALLRERIADRFPQHGIVGEEFGAEQEGAEFVWVIDPIDGTGAFVSGLPTFGTLIGLLQEGRPLLGVLEQPVLGERWLGVDAPGVIKRTTHNSQVIHSAQTAKLREATAFATTPHMFEGDAEPAWNRLRTQCGRVRYGADCYAYGLLAAGYVDLVCEADLKAWDYLPLVPIVTGAGGVMTDWTGAALTLAGGDRVLAAASQPLARAARAALSGGDLQIGGQAG